VKVRAKVAYKKGWRQASLFFDCDKLKWSEAKAAESQLLINSVVSYV